MSEIYRGIGLLSASTVDSITDYKRFYVVFCHVASSKHEPVRVEQFRRTSVLCICAPYERIRPASKVKLVATVWTSTWALQMAMHFFPPIMFLLPKDSL